MEQIRLKTVRPFLMKSISLSEDSGLDSHPSEKDKITIWLIKQVESLIATAKREWVKIQSDAVEEKDIPLPLVRLKVEYSGGYQVENVRRFSNRFVGRVANVDDVIQFYKRRATGISSGSRAHRLGAADTETLSSDSMSLEKLKVQNLVENYLKEYALELLPENGLGDAVTKFVDKEDREAVKKYVLCTCLGFESYKIDLLTAHWISKYRLSSNWVILTKAP